MSDVVDAFANANKPAKQLYTTLADFIHRETGVMPGMTQVLDFTYWHSDEYLFTEVVPDAFSRNDFLGVLTEMRHHITLWLTINKHKHQGNHESH